VQNNMFLDCNLLRIKAASLPHVTEVSVR
jgi:hypothetical protein